MLQALAIGIGVCALLVAYALIGWTLILKAMGIDIWAELKNCNRLQ